MTIRKLPSGVYQVDVCRVDPITGQEKRVRRNARTRKLAEQIERDVADAIKAGTFGKVEKTAPTLAEFWRDTYLPTYAQTNNRASTVAAKRAQWARLDAIAGERRIDDITKESVAQIRAALVKRGYATGTVNVTLALLSSMLMTAEELDVISRAPRVQGLRTTEKRPDFLSIDELRAVLDALDGRWRTAAIVAATTGLRSSEVCALHWSSIHWERKTIDVIHNISLRKIVDVTKGGRPRTVPMTAWCEEELRRHPRTLGSPYVFPAVSPRATVGTMTRGALLQEIRNAAMAAIQRPVTTRLLRHTYATQLRALGAELHVIQELLGHRTVRVTEVYAHASSNPLATQATDRLDDALGGSVTRASLDGSASGGHSSQGRDSS